MSSYAVLDSSSSTHSDLTVTSTSSAVSIGVISSKKYIEATYTFKIQITISNGRTATYGTLLTLDVQCGASSTTMSFGAYPNSKGVKQFVAKVSSGSASPF